MAPIEFQAVRGRRASSGPGSGPPTEPAGARVPPAGPVFGRADGLWARPPVEVEHAWRQVSVLIDRVAAGRHREFEELSPAERYTAGVVLAAGWCIGVRSRSPLTGARGVVTPERVTSELAAAEAMVAVQDPGWEAAAGVRAWLLWITGASDNLTTRET